MEGNLEQIFFSSWDSLLRTFIIGILGYIMVVIFLRISGKRTLSKMNAFDLIVTVSLGSILATVLLSKDVALADGAIAFVVLVGLQFTVTWSSVRVKWLRQVITGEPLMLLYRGQFFQTALRQSRVTEEEVMSAIRSARVISLGMVEAVVLETDGSFSVVLQNAGEDSSSLDGVRSPKRQKL